MTRSGSKKWSKAVTEHSDALDLEHGIFAQSDPKRIAVSLKQSAERSRRRKSSPFRSAMSMLSFYLNRAGPNVAPEQQRRLEAAKDELRTLFNRPPASSPRKVKKTAPASKAHKV